MVPSDPSETSETPEGTAGKSEESLTTSRTPTSTPSASERPGDEATTFWGWMRQTARLWGFMVFILIVLIVFRSVIMPFALGVLVAYILAPVLYFLGKVRIGRFKPPRFVWVIVIFAVLLGLQVLFFTSFIPRISKDFKRIVQEAPIFWKKVNRVWVPALASWMEKNFGEVAPAPLKQKTPPPPAEPTMIRLKVLPDGVIEIDPRELNLEVIQQVPGTWSVRSPRPPSNDPKPDHRFADAAQRYVNDFVQSSERRLNQLFQLGQFFVVGLLKAITTFILVFMISGFLLVDTEKIMRAMRSLMPIKYFGDFDNVVRLIDKGLSGAIRGQLLICVINAILTWIGLVLIGVKYPLLLAMLAGVMSLIPIFGSIISSIPIIIVALVSTPEGMDLLKGVMILLWVIGIHLLEANVLNPKIIGTAARIHPVIVIFAVVAGERTYGPIGALLGVPLVSAVQAIFIYLRERVRRDPL